MALLGIVDHQSTPGPVAPEVPGKDRELLGALLGLLLGLVGRFELLSRSLRVAVRSSIWVPRRSLAESSDLSSSTSSSPRTLE